LGVKERQEREREAVSRAILDAARDLFVAEGYQNVSIRKIADRIEYSPAAIYSYFPSKDDIFFALAEEGFHLLFATPPAEIKARGLAALRQAFWHFYEFSKSHREHFALMFLDRSVPRITKHWERFAFIAAMKEQLSALVQQAVDDGELPKDTNAHATFRILSAAVLGTCVLPLCNRLAPGEDPDAHARDTLEAAIAGLQTNFRRTFQPPAPCQPFRPPESEIGPSESER
jgi:AcrR family transcriptional regulator